MRDRFVPSSIVQLISRQVESMELNGGAEGVGAKLSLPAELRQQLIPYLDALFVTWPIPFVRLELESPNCRPVVCTTNPVLLSQNDPGLATLKALEPFLGIVFLLNRQAYIKFASSSVARLGFESSSSLINHSIFEYFPSDALSKGLFDAFCTPHQEIGLNLHVIINGLPRHLRLKIISDQTQYRVFVECCNSYWI